MKKTIAFCTGTRAEYGLLKPLMELVLQDERLNFELYVTGMHLSPEFGNTIDLIEKDLIPISEKIEILVSGDSPSAVTKSMGLAMIGFADVFNRHKPDVLVILGDRFEAFCLAAAATVARIPIAHLHGGELTEGAIDDAFRHAITKMSYLHFTSTEEYRRRVIRMGECPARVFNVGALGIENIKNLPLLDRPSLERELGVKLGEKYALVTFHPATLEDESPVVQMRELLAALDKELDLFVVFTKANADASGRVINSMIDEYVSKYSRRSIAFTSMGQIRYLSTMRLASVVIGNSSSGIIEAPSFGIPTVNIGDRQKGRVRAKSIIDCAARQNAITSAIKESLDPAFGSRLVGLRNPYEGEQVSRKILDAIRDAVLPGESFFKSFYEDEVL